MQGAVLYRLEYYASGIPEGMTIQEQRDKGIYGTHEIGIVIELSQRIDGRTDVIATCTHPAYDQEFTAMFGALDTRPDIESEPAKTESPAKQTYETGYGGTGRPRSEANKWLVEQHLEQRPPTVFAV
jgi:hypothetical protein